MKVNAARVKPGCFSSCVLSMAIQVVYYILETLVRGYVISEWNYINWVILASICNLWRVLAEFRNERAGTFLIQLIVVEFEGSAATTQAWTGKSLNV